MRSLTKPLQLAALPLLLAFTTLLSACGDSSVLPEELSGSPGNPNNPPQAEEPPCVAI